MNEFTEEDLESFQDWYEDWWMSELPGRTMADIWYERLYDWRLRNRPAEMIRIGAPHNYAKDVVG